MTPEEFFASFRASAWRLETLSRYDNGDPALAHFEATGELLPLEQRPAKQRWMAAVREAVTAGKTVSRVHVVPPGLTTYLRYELATYAENVEAGEDVRIAPARSDGDMLWLRGLHDFWLLDGDTNDPLILLVDYDEDGRPTGITGTREDQTVRRCRWTRKVALGASVSLAEYLATA